MARFIGPEKEILRQVMTAHAIEVDNRMRESLRNFEEYQTQASKDELIGMIDDVRYTYRILHKLVCDENESSPTKMESHWSKKAKELRNKRKNWLRRKTIDDTPEKEKEPASAGENA